LEAMHIGGLEAARGTKIRPACWLAGDDCILEEPENFLKLPLVGEDSIVIDQLEPTHLKKIIFL